MKTLTIKLTAPLQSYGNEATFNRRTTYHQPSKSAILGMIAAALGYDRTDPRIPQLNNLLFATRTDQINDMTTDFQTVWPRIGKDPNSKLTYRDYWSDAIFVVAIASDNDDFIDQIEYALHHPRYQLYLGRKSNPPAGPLETHLYPNEGPMSVFQRLPWQASKWYQKAHRYDPTYTVQITADAELLPIYPSKLVKDAIGSFNPCHRYAEYRRVVMTHKPITNNAYQPKEEILAGSTQQDAFNAIADN